MTFLAKQMQQHHQTIFSVENLQPTWLPNRWKVIHEQCMRLIIGLVVGLSTGLADGWNFIALFCGVSSWEICWQFTFPDLLREISALSPDTRRSPNKQIWLYGASGLAIGLVSGLLLGLVTWLTLRPFIGHGMGLLVGTFIFMLLTGIEDPFARHFLLRLFLWLRGDLPWNLVPFLDEATERLLLRKVGGSYIFAHRLLLDYFASLGGSLPSESTYSEDKEEPHEANV